MEGNRPTKSSQFQAFREEGGNTSHQLRRAGFDQTLLDPHYTWNRIPANFTKSAPDGDCEKKLCTVCKGFSLLTNKFDWFQIVIKTSLFQITCINLPVQPLLLSTHILEH